MNSRPEPNATGGYRFEDFVVDPSVRTVTAANGRIVPLTGAEFDLLIIFLNRPGRVLSREQLLDLDASRGRRCAGPVD